MTKRHKSSILDLLMKYANWVKKAVTPDVENYHILPYDEAKRKRFALINLLYGGVFFILIFCAGIINHPSSRTAWIFYPYILIMIPAAYFFAGALAFMKCPVNLSKKQWESSLARCKHSAAGLLILSVIHLILEVIFIIVHRADGVFGKEAVYLSLFSVMIFICIIYGKFFDKKLVNNLT